MASSHSFPVNGVLICVVMATGCFITSVGKVSTSDKWKLDSFAPTHALEYNTSAEFETTYQKDFIHTAFDIDDYDDNEDEDEMFTPNLDLPQMDVLPFDDKPFLPDPSPTAVEKKPERGRSRDKDREGKKRKERKRKKDRNRKKDKNKDTPTGPTLGYEFPDMIELPEVRPSRPFGGRHQVVPTTFPSTVPVTLTLPHMPMSFRDLSDEERLMKTLFTDYNPSARPVMNSSNTVSVSIQFSLMHLKDLHVISQVLTTTGLLILEWKDERLTWNPEDHNNLTEIIIEAKGLWRPEFAVINGAEKIYEDYNQFRSVISHEGLIHWEPGGVFKTMCEIDITYYPFDEQRCDLMFGAWSYHTSKMNLTNSSAIINLDSYKLNGEWEIYRTNVERKEFSYECCPNQKFAYVAFTIYLRRRHTFYVLNVILPSIMTSVLLLTVFFCTPGQKVQIGVVVLLSFRIFLLNVAGNIPKTSDHIPLLGIYLTCTMAITTLSMVLTVFVLNLHHVTDRPVPTWAKRLVFIYIARMLCMCNMFELENNEQNSPQNNKNKTNKKLALYRVPVDSVVNDSEERTAIIELQNRNLNGGTDSKLGTPLETAYPMLNKIQKDKEEKEKETNYSKDWIRMAEVFDRLFFWMFLLAILISTLVLFHPLTNRTEKKT